MPSVSRSAAKQSSQMGSSSSSKIADPRTEKTLWKETASFISGEKVYRNYTTPMTTEIVIARLKKNNKWNVESNPQVFEEKSFKSKQKAYNYAKTMMLKHPKGK